MHSIPGIWALITRLYYGCVQAGDAIAWATEVLAAGIETEHLWILVGEPRDAPWSEIKPILDRVLDELGFVAAPHPLSEVQSPLHWSAPVAREIAFTILEKTLFASERDPYMRAARDGAFTILRQTFSSFEGDARLAGMIWDIVRAIDRGTVAPGEGGGYLNNLVSGFDGCPATLARLIELTSCLEYLDWPEDIHPYECDIREEASALVGRR